MKKQEHEVPTPPATDIALAETALAYAEKEDVAVTASTMAATLAIAHAAIAIAKVLHNQWEEQR